MHWREMVLGENWFHTSKHTSCFNWLCILSKAILAESTLANITECHVYTSICLIIGIFRIMLIKIQTTVDS